MNKKGTDKIVCEWSMKHGVALTSEALDALVDKIHSDVVDHFAHQRLASVSGHAEILIELYDAKGTLNKYAIAGLRAALAIKRTPEDALLHPAGPA